MTGGCSYLTSMVPTCHSDSNRKAVFIHSLRIILIILFDLPALARVPEQPSRQSLTIIMPSYSLNAPLGEAWTVDQDDKTENVSFKKSATQPCMSSILQVIKKTVANKKKALSEPELAEDLFREEESKLQKELVEKQLSDLKEIKKGKTTIGGKKLDYMSYKVSKDKVGVDAILYLYFPENYLKIQAFYVFAIGMDQVAVSKLLIESGADINLESTNGWTALMEAAYKNNVPIAKLLIENGADVNAKDAMNNTP